MRRTGPWLFCALWAVLYAGLFVHPGPFLPSARAQALSYIVILAVGCAVFALPWFLLRMRAALGSWSRTALMWVPALGVALVLYVLAGAVYTATRRYDFHPFLQVAPPSFEPIPKEKPPGVFRVLALGGSTTEGPQLSDTEKYPAVLQRLLSERLPQAKVQVLNGGRSWYTTEHAFIEYAFGARDWNPDVVVFFEAINDLYRSCLSPRWTDGEYQRDYSHFYGPVMNAHRPPSWEAFLTTLIASEWYASLRAAPRPANVPLEQFPSIEAHALNTRLFAQMLRAEGRKLVLATQASLYRTGLSQAEERSLEFGIQFCTRNDSYPDNASLKRAMDAMNADTRAIAAEMNIPLADLDATIPKTGEYLRDDVHFTAKGARLAAQTIADVLLRMR